MALLSSSSEYPDNINPFVSSQQGPSTSNSAMGRTDDKIFFVAIIRNEETLVKFAQFAGNYDEILAQVLPKIVKTNGIKMTLNYETFCFHYMYDNTIIYFCITKNVFDKYKAFKFLDRIKEKFESQYQKRIHTALSFAFQAEFLPTLVLETKRYSENMSFDKMNEVESRVIETKQILSQNIDKLTERGEKLHLLVDRSENMCEASVSFKTQSRSLARSMFFKNIRFLIIIGMITLVAVYLIVSASCGGPTWKNCIK